MNIRFKSRYLVLLLSASIFFSCKKDDKTSPTPPEEKPTLFSQVQGRWDVAEDLPLRISAPAFSAKSKTSSKIQDRPHVTSVEFFSDSTYVLVFNYYEVYTSKFSAKDSATLDFEGFGDVSEIKIGGDSISFSCVYYETPLTVKAKKVVDLTVSQDKKALLKNWVVTREEDGQAIYDEYHLSDTAEMAFQFTVAGTFLQKLSEGGITNINPLNWKWYPGKDNSIAIYNGYDMDYSDVDYIKIVELSDAVLKVQIIAQKPVYENEQVVGYTDELRYALKLVKK